MKNSTIVLIPYWNSICAPFVVMQTSKCYSAFRQTFYHISRWTRTLKFIV